MITSEIYTFILKTLCPINVIGLPYLLFMVLSAPNPPGPGYMDVKWIVAFTLFIGASWTCCLAYTLWAYGFVKLKKKES